MLQRTLASSLTLVGCQLPHFAVCLHQLKVRWLYFAATEDRKSDRGHTHWHPGPALIHTDLGVAVELAQAAERVWWQTLFAGDVGNICIARANKQPGWKGVLKVMNPSQTWAFELHHALIQSFLFFQSVILTLFFTLAFLNFVFCQCSMTKDLWVKPKCKCLEGKLDPFTVICSSVDVIC